MRLDTWGLPAALRAAGLTVVETPGWQNRIVRDRFGNRIDLPSNPTVVWHHDASPKGDSPGALQWMIDNYASASAQIWIDRQGVVYLVGSGVAWHAGKVLSGSEQYDNYHAIGIETDHTVNEDWPAPLLNSLRVTTAVILDKAGRARTEFSFHKKICSPVGRKVDPDGLDLAAERSAVYSIGRTPTPPQPSPVPSTPSVEPAPVPAGPSQPESKYDNRTYPGHLLQEGMYDIADEAIHTLQNRLNAHMKVLGQPQLKVDGDFGPATKKAVLTYQNVRRYTHKLGKPDGIVGPKTWASIWV